MRSSVALRQLVSTHRAITATIDDEYDTCTQKVIDDHLTTHATRQRTVAKSNTPRSAANVLPALEPPLEPGTITAPGSTSTHASNLAQHPTHVHTKAMQDMQLLVPAPTRPNTLTSCHPLARPSVVTRPHATTPGRRSLIRPTPANNATSGGQKKHSIQSRRAGIILGKCVEAVASRAEQSSSTKEESGRDHVCRRLDTCRRAPQRCAPFVLPGCSQAVEHLDLEPDAVQETEMMRSCSRRSHHLRGKSARTIADKSLCKRHGSVGAWRL